MVTVITQQLRTYRVSGIGYLAGTAPDGRVTIDGVPGRALIDLFDYQSRQWLRQTVSRDDGTYLFQGIDTGVEYALWARDFSGAWDDIVVGGVQASTHPLLIRPLPDAISGQPYEHTIRVDYGTEPISIQIPGSLPAGLTASNDTISGAQVTGAPGIYPVTITAEDADAREVTRVLILRVL